MPLIITTVQTLEDAKTQKNGITFSHLAPRLNITHACVMEGGTVEGKASIFFRLVDDAGKEYYAETTAALLHALDAVTRGAELRFEIERIDKQ